MAGSCTVTQETNPSKLKPRGLSRVRWAWTGAADASGVSGVGSSRAISGRIHSIRFLAGTPLPLSGYDVTLKDMYGFDVLGNLGQNIPNSNAAALTRKLMINSMAAMQATSLQPAITNCGSSTQGIIDLVYEVF